MRFLKLSFVLSLAGFSFFFVQKSFAQEEDTMAYKHIQVGAGGTLGASIFNGTVPDGSKTDIHFPAYLIQAMGIYAFHPYWGVALGVGYESRGMYFKQQNVTEPNVDFSLNYFSLQPSIKFKQFLLGVTIGLPLGASVKSNPGSGVPSRTTDIGKDTMNTLIDIRIGGMLPIVESDAGSLYFLINASWNLSDAFNQKFYTPGQTVPTGQTAPTPITKSPIHTIQIGLSYLFAPGGKTH
jgi:hypothetical protein